MSENTDDETTKPVETVDMYRAVFENTETGTIIIDHDMTILFANATFEAMTGYSRTGIENTMKWSQFVYYGDIILN